MAKKSKQSISERLLAAQVAIDNALGDAEILAELSVFGYTEEKLNAGKQLQEEAQDLVNQQKTEYGEQYQASEDFYAAWDTADKAYMRTLKVARVAFRGNDKAATSLMLNGDRGDKFSEWLEQAQSFYQNLLANQDLASAMAEFGYDTAKLESENALVEAAVQANATQEQEKGEAQDSTKIRDAKLAEMDRWMLDYKEIAKVALEDNPQLLKKLGFGAVE